MTRIAALCAALFLAWLNSAAVLLILAAFICGRLSKGD